jgi:hypothetical protein
MRIGIDFDNTIVCYDGVFYRAALDLGLIPADLAPSKNGVRDYLNNSGQAEAFTKLQGHVYGSRMDLASCYPGAKRFVFAAAAAGHELFVVSHKTRHPILGPKHDLHAAARGFLVAENLVGPGAFRPENVFFAQTKEQKVARVADLDCQVFIDDLPEILSTPGFPAGLRAVLFDPEARFSDLPGFERHESWVAIEAALLGSRR